MGGHQCDVLVWLAGDVSQYVLVNYELPGLEKKETFTSVAYLAHALKPRKLVVLVPETLFEDKHCENYRLLLKAKSGFEGYRLFKKGLGEDITIEDKLVHKLLQEGFECYVVPHPGIAMPLKLDVSGKKVSVYRSSGREYPSYGFNLLFSSIYIVLSRYASSFKKICVDITHGTNVLVSAVLLVSTILPTIYDVDIKLYSAPVMGRLSRESVVKYLVLDDAVKAVREVAAGAQAWSMVDERMLRTDYYTRLGSKLGPRYRSVYSSVETVLRESQVLLWGLRSGQIPVLMPFMKKLYRDLRTAQENLQKVLSQEIPLDNEPHQEKWREHAHEPPWPPIASIILVLTNKLLEQLYSDKNKEFIDKALQLLLEKGYPDKVLGVGREWLVALYLLYKGRYKAVKVGSQEWSCAEEALRSKESGVKEVFEKTRIYRNMLMHGRLSREENLVLKFEENDIVVQTPQDVKPQPITYQDTVKVAKELLELIKKLERMKSKTGNV